MVIFIGFFLLQTSKGVYQFRAVLWKHRGRDLRYDVNMITSQQRLSRIV